jgi:hypothetical protein
LPVLFVPPLMTHATRTPLSRAGRKAG